MKNFTEIAGRYFGDDSVLFKSLQEGMSHVKKRETSYNYELHQDELFGGHFLDTINWRVHHSLNSYAAGNPEEIEVNIESRSYYAKAPA